MAVPVGAAFFCFIRLSCLMRQVAEDVFYHKVHLRYKVHKGSCFVRFPNAECVREKSRREIAKIRRVMTRFFGEF